MHTTNSLIYTVLGLAPLAARADLQLDADDISPACQSVCRPVRELSQTCDIQNDDNLSDQTEDNLTLQCYCTNNSFDVGSITALCASCMQQNPDSDDDDDDLTPDSNNDINEIMARCGFQSTSYAAAQQSTTADGISVAATRLTNSAQLTTTISGGVAVSMPTVVTSTGVTSTSGPATTTTGTSTATTTSSTGAAATTVTTAGAVSLESFTQNRGLMVLFAVGVATVGAFMS